MYEQFGNQIKTFGGKQMVKVSPCKGCSEKNKQDHNHPYCHTNCEDYILWKNERDALSLKIREENARYPVELIKRNENLKIKRRQRK
jgi:hypothetical protein